MRSNGMKIAPERWQKHVVAGAPEELVLRLDLGDEVLMLALRVETPATHTRPAEDPRPATLADAADAVRILFFQGLENSRKGDPHS